MKRDRKRTPTLEQLEALELLSTVPQIHHPNLHPTVHHFTRRSPHVTASASGSTLIRGAVNGALTPPVLDNAPWTFSFTNRITIGGVVYPNALFSGEFSTKTQRGRMSILTAAGELNTNLVVLANLSAGNYVITSGTGAFNNAFGGGVMLMKVSTNSAGTSVIGANTSTITASFNPHEYH